MEIKAGWSKIGEFLFDADAQKVADEIMAIGDQATPEQIVEKGKDPASELHKCFTWDDHEAAEKYRLYEARKIVGCLVIHREEVQENVPETRVFHKNDSGGYKPATYIFTNAKEHEKLLQAAYADLQAFKRKYDSLQELDYILRLIA